MAVVSNINSIEEHVDDTYHLTPLQHGMTFHTLLEPDAGFDVQQIIVEFDHEVAADNLRRAWRVVTECHPVLRTRFRFDGKASTQEVLTSSLHVWTDLDWTISEPAGRSDRLNRFLLSDRRAGFDLAAGPPWRLTLLRLSERHSVLVWTFHHALLDAAAWAAVLAEVFDHYDGTAAEPTIHRPFRDYVDWLDRQDFRTSEPYWREVFDGLEGPTRLTHISRARRHALKEEETRAGLVEVDLEPGISRAVREFAKSEQVTLNTIAIATWALLLARDGMEKEVIFGVARSCRRTGLDKADTIVGLVTNTLPLRVHVDPDAAVGPWLEDIRTRWQAVRPHEHSSLVDIRSYSQFPHDTPLFESAVMFDTQTLEGRLRTHSERWRSRRCKVRELPNIPAMLAVYGEDELRLSLTYDRQLIEDERAQLMLRRAQMLFEAICVDPRRKIREIAPASENESRSELVTWNQTSIAFGREDATIYELFERQALRTPDAIAITAGQTQWTYGQFHRAVAHAARQLAELSVERGNFVAICARRSPWTIAVMLGALRAGCAYIHIDPAYPPERIAFTMEDSQAALLIADLHVLETVRFPEGTRTAPLDMFDAFSQLNPDPIPYGHLSDLACMIYTSGSTGRPKGVLIENRAVVNHLLWMQHAFPLDANDAVLQNTSLSFDVSGWEIFGPLTVGARIALAPSGPTDPRALSRLVAKERVTVLQLVPSLLRALLDTAEFAECKSLRHVFCGGETMSEDIPSKFFSTLDCELHNMYGPTEAAIDSLFHTVPRDYQAGVIPIGRPVANMRAYLLTEGLEPVQPGLAGELYLGGIQLARGYHNRPEQTSASFLSDAFHIEANGRLYRTGDKVRRLPNGDLLFLGRIDHQAKIRGFRVELGEIEHTLLRQSSVKEAVALVQRGAPGDGRLIAYVTTRDGPASAREALDIARRALPAHMIPQIVWLEELPLLPNGKLDRKALERIEAPMGAQKAGAAPETRTEIKLAAMWSELLSASDIRSNDNFFDLGGHSLLAVRLVSLVKKLQGARIDVSDVYRHPELGQLAAFLSDRARAGERQPGVITLQDGDHTLPIYFVNGGLLEWRQAPLMGSGAAYGLAGTWPRIWFEAAAAERASELPDINAMADQFFEDFRSHAGGGPCVLVGHSVQGIVAFELARRFIERGGDVSHVILFDTVARRPSPASVFWRQLQQRLNADRTVKSALRSLVFRLRFRVRNLRKKAAPPPVERWLTDITDEEGVAQHWGLVERISISVEKSFRPLPLNTRGILFRADQEAPSDDFSVMPDLGWTGLFTRGLDVVWLPGDHKSIYGADRPDAHVTEIVRQVVEEASRSTLKTPPDRAA